jgi:hypothetical protein
MRVFCQYTPVPKVWTLLLTAAALQAQVPAECLGTVSSERKLGQLVVVSTKLTPSAGCVVVLSADRKWKTTLHGVLLAAISEQHLIVQENQIHFTAVKPAELVVHELVSGETRVLYPMKEDPLRRAFTSQLRSRIDMAWCQENNMACAPERFHESIGPLDVNEEKREFSFDTVFLPDGFGPKAASEVRRRKLRYTFRLANGRWEGSGRDR